MKMAKVSMVLVGLLSGAERTGASIEALQHALQHWKTGQKTPIVQTLTYMGEKPVTAKGLTAEGIRAYKPLPKYRSAVLALAQACASVDAGESPENVALNFKALKEAENETLAEARRASLTTEQIAARAAKAAASTAKRAKKDLDDAMGLIQAHGKAGTLPAWFIAHMGELSKAHA